MHSVTRSVSDGMIHRMESTKIDLPRQPANQAASEGWSSLRLLPSAVWLGLLGVLVAVLAVAAIAERSGRLIAMGVLCVALLAMVARVFAAEAARERRARAAAELQTAEFERLIEIRTRELSELSTHLQEFA